MVDLMAFSARETGNRERQEDYAVHEYIKTPTGLNLYIAIACDGAGGGEAGEMAARLTARSVIDHIEISNETNIPRLLIEAVTSANELVYSELRGEGTSTVAMIAIDLSDPTAPNGRMYGASVGDSYICMIRDGQLVRLNIDHILANEYIYAGQMSVQEARRLANAEYPTRVIGVNPDIQVDIGFYAEKGNNFVNSRRAFNIGKVGMKLLEGDTLFVASDGIFRVGQGNRRPYVHKDEILRHGMDDDPERIVRALFRYATQRRPDDNLCMSIVLIPSRLRRPVRASAEISWQQRFALGAIAIALLLIAVVFFIQFATSQRGRNNPDASNPLLNAIENVEAITPEPTRTSANQIGIQFFAEPNADNALSVPLFLRRSFSYNDVNYLKIDGLNIQVLPDSFLPASVFMQSNSVVEILEVQNQAPESVTMSIDTGSDIFVNAGEFSSGGFRVQFIPDLDFRLNTRRTECLSVRHLAAGENTLFDVPTLSLSCYTGDSTSCNFRTPENQRPTEMVIGQEYILDAETGEVLMITEPDYEQIKAYYNTVVTLQGDDLSATCLASYLDVDGDGVLYPNDACESDTGLAGNRGCPAGVSPTTEASED